MNVQMKTQQKHTVIFGFEVDMVGGLLLPGSPSGTK